MEDLKSGGSVNGMLLRTVKLDGGFLSLAAGWRDGVSEDTWFSAASR